MINNYIFWKLSVLKLFTKSESELELNHDLGFQEDMFRFGDETIVIRDPDGDSSWCDIFGEQMYYKFADDFNDR